MHTEQEEGKEVQNDRKVHGEDQAGAADADGVIRSILARPLLPIHPRVVEETSKQSEARCNEAEALHLVDLVKLVRLAMHVEQQRDLHRAECKDCLDHRADHVAEHLNQDEREFAPKHAQLPVVKLRLVSFIEKPKASLNPDLVEHQVLVRSDRHVAEVSHRPGRNKGYPNDRDEQ